MKRLGVLSDAHGNLPGFEAGLRLLERERVDDIVFLGDAVGYVPHPGVVQALRRLGIVSLLGNHEAMLLGPPVELEDVYQFERCRSQLTPSEVAWLAGLPVSMSLMLDDVEVQLFHGSPADPLFGYVYPDSDLNGFNLSGGVIVVTGNTHRPMSRASDLGTLFCNPGSCGLPRDFGDLGAVGVLDAANREFRTLRFDISDMTSSWIANCEPVHETVKALLVRVKH